MTEDTLVAAIEAIVAPTSRASKLRVGIGDDAAVWKPSRSAESVITTDALVEDVHFDRTLMNARETGHRALAANLSDIAAMGARPLIATIALGLSRSIDEAWILDFYRGMAALALRFGTALAGGDIVSAPSLFVAITVVGEVRTSNRKTRDGARPGDALAVTGPLGASRAGLELLTERKDLCDEARFASALEAFRTPEPRMREGTHLGASRHVHAMMDLSDGISTDLRRMCAASGMGAIVDASAVPISPSARSFAETVGKNPLGYALHGGEDFELMVAVAPRALDYLSGRLRAATGRELHRIGTVTEGSAVMLRNESGTIELESSGWDHLRER